MLYISAPVPPDVKIEFKLQCLEASVSMSTVVAWLAKHVASGRIDLNTLLSADDDEINAASLLAPREFPQHIEEWSHLLESWLEGYHEAITHLEAGNYVASAQWAEIEATAVQTLLEMAMRRRG